MKDRLRRAFDWLCRDRKTGRIVLAQLPNVPLALFLAATVLRRIFDPAGRLGTAIDVVATGALVWWAGDEVLRGVNPFRRMFGGAVLLAIVAALLLR